MDSAIDGSSATISEVVYFILAPKKKNLHRYTKIGDCSTHK